MTGIVTRFRAYQLDCAGSSFSYFANGALTIIEGRLTATSRQMLVQEMRNCGVEVAKSLHITSWDADHCSSNELEELLALARPEKIECPGYSPHTDGGVECYRIIEQYRNLRSKTNRPAEVTYVTPAYISSLASAKELAYNNIFYHPRVLDSECANNNSTVKLLRKGSFNVLSLGDVEDPSIAAQLRNCRVLKRETDVMILAHHGADNGFTNKRFLQRVSPHLAVCSSDYDNRYDHPRDKIRELLHDEGIRLMTTKTGDVVVRSTGTHTGQFEAINLKAGSTDVSSVCKFTAKKSKLLSYNGDTIRQLYKPRPAHR